MKATYLKPTTEEILINTPALMLTISGDGEKIVGDGGETGGEGGPTEGDSRRNFSIWDEE